MRSTELRKCEHKNEMGGNWGKEGAAEPISSFLFPFFPAPPNFRVPFTFPSSPLSERLEQTKGEEESKASIILKGKSET